MASLKELFEAYGSGIRVQSEDSQVPPFSLERYKDEEETQLIGILDDGRVITVLAECETTNDYNIVALTT